jgi:hypothetical protein
MSDPIELKQMGLDLLPILPCALPSASAQAFVGQSAQPQQHCQNFMAVGWPCAVLLPSF